MPDAADKTKSLLTLTAVVASRVRINGIRLRCCRATADLPSPGTPLRIEFGFNGETTADRESNKIAVRAFLMVRANTADGSESRSLAFQLEAEFLLDYAINSFDGITEEELDAFGKMNGIYNVWPYWRQYVQTTTVSMGFPALTLPVLTGETILRTYEEQETAAKTTGDTLPQQSPAATTPSP